MPNVFEGQPDARQSDDSALPLSRFRPRYRALGLGEVALHDALKARYEDVEELMVQLPPGRYRSLAMTALEESCMWGIKALTDNTSS